MKVLGTARKKKGIFTLPDELLKTADDALYEVLEVEGIILMIESPLDKKRMARIQALAEESIKTHKKTLERLANFCKGRLQDIPARLVFQPLYTCQLDGAEYQHVGACGLYGAGVAAFLPHRAYEPLQRGPECTPESGSLVEPG